MEFPTTRSVFFWFDKWAGILSSKRLSPRFEAAPTALQRVKSSSPINPSLFSIYGQKRAAVLLASAWFYSSPLIGWSDPSLIACAEVGFRFFKAPSSRPSHPTILKTSRMSGHVHPGDEKSPPAFRRFPIKTS